MKIITKFAGKNGSLGYENGKYYSLTLRMEKEKVWITRKEEWGEVLVNMLPLLNF